MPAGLHRYHVAVVLIWLAASIPTVLAYRSLIQYASVETYLCLLVSTDKKLRSA